MALILIAEDTAEIADLLRDILEARGHQVAVATDGVQLIEKGKSLMPKLIVSDIMMPGAYGSAAYKALQEDSHTKNIPVIFLTGVNEAAAAKVVPATAKVRLLFKPLDIPLFLKTVGELLAGA